MGKVCKLEDDLIHPNKWAKLYDSMPTECREIVDDNTQCIGIGKNEKYGWFIMERGQGPTLLWTENKKEDKKDG